MKIAYCLSLLEQQVVQLEQNNRYNGTVCLIKYKSATINYKVQYFLRKKYYFDISLEASSPSGLEVFVLHCPAG